MVMPASFRSTASRVTAKRFQAYVAERCVCTPSLISIADHREPMATFTPNG